MTILEEASTSSSLKSSSTISKKQNNVVPEDTNRNHLENIGLAASKLDSNKRDRSSSSINLDESVIRALSSSNSAMISAVGDRYITPEYLAPLPSSTVRI